MLLLVIIKNLHHNKYLYMRYKITLLSTVIKFITQKKYKDKANECITKAPIYHLDEHIELRYTPTIISFFYTKV